MAATADSSSRASRAGVSPRYSSSHDNVGSDRYNQNLSQRRALSVAQYFESQRVDPLRLATAGKGEGQPVASNASEAGRQLNRRVEIYVEPVVEG